MATGASFAESTVILASAGAEARLSLSVTVVLTAAVPSVAFTGAERATEKFSSSSIAVSLVTLTVTVCEVVPGAKVSVPLLAAKSLPAAAEPATVL